ncbi:hypothetical protein GCM10010493_50030 [Streptomyces lavendulae subsp. grasserius]
MQRLKVDPGYQLGKFCQLLPGPVDAGAALDGATPSRGEVMFGSVGGEQVLSSPPGVVAESGAGRLVHGGLLDSSGAEVQRYDDHRIGACGQGFGAADRRKARLPK